MGKLGLKIYNDSRIFGVFNIQIANSLGEK